LQAAIHVEYTANAALKNASPTISSQWSILQRCRDLLRLGVTMGSCTAEQLVTLKRETKTTLSYAGIAKRAEFLGFAPQNSLAKIAWKKLKESIYGVPFYKQRLAARMHRS
jgi:hypothetical protein